MLLHPLFDNKMARWMTEQERLPAENCCIIFRWKRLNRDADQASGKWILDISGPFF